MGFPMDLSPCLMDIYECYRFSCGSLAMRFCVCCNSACLHAWLTLTLLATITVVWLCTAILACLPCLVETDQVLGDSDFSDTGDPLCTCTTISIFNLEHLNKSDTATPPHAHTLTYNAPSLPPSLPPSLSLSLSSPTINPPIHRDNIL